jgi:UDP-N-acetylglucosamine--N-acetylmuramyl-(pentapeptide) pyrophosphoryl-undecaprenol N-acetylglucosamine transferase
MMLKVIISGGGTGGHVFPAIAIADAIREKVSTADILFIGAKGKLEMEKVPAAGYRIEGLGIAGFQRKMTWKNLSFPFKLAASMLKARKLVSQFRPDIIIGVGGYASGPVLRTGVSMKIPALIQEQNSLPGITNRILAPKVQKICVAYPGMDRFFPKEKIVFTGNPIRKDLAGLSEKRKEGLQHFGLKDGRLVLLVIGGSLGAGTINRSVMSCIMNRQPGGGVQWLWQCGKYSHGKYIHELNVVSGSVEADDIHLNAFIDRMDLAYAAADVVISRAGAIAISELCVAGKPVILIPSPNVAEDHQTRNARALADKHAALMIRDDDAVEALGPALAGLLADTGQQEEMRKNISGLAVTDAASRIASEALALVGKKEN